MKGNKKLLAIAILLLLITVSFTTYAIYKSSADGEVTVKTAAWVVEVNDTDIVRNNTFTITDVTWATPTIGKNNTIAPGDEGTIEIEIDASEYEVDVYYEVEIGTLTASDGTIPATQTKLTAKTSNGTNKITGTIPYGASMTETITLDVVWEAVDNED